jgi:hypothetical protein
MPMAHRIHAFVPTQRKWGDGRGGRCDGSVRADARKHREGGGPFPLRLMGCLLDVVMP